MDPSSATPELVGRPSPPGKPQQDGGLAGNPFDIIGQPFRWIRMLCLELKGTFVLGVVIVYGLGHGFSGDCFKVVADYYWKDVQKVQPSAVQMFVGIYYIPRVMKPLWGVLTDVVPVCGYRRRPYFIAAGILGTTVSIAIAAYKLPLVLALLCFVGITAAVAIANVTIDACIARNSIERPELAADMQSLCSFVSSIGEMIGSSMSGVFVHLLGAQLALGLMAIPSMMLVVLGFVIYELRTCQPLEKTKVLGNVRGGAERMAKTIQCPQVWKPSLYMYLSIALSISTHEGQFYWYTDPTAGPAFSQEFVGIIYAVGATASIVGIVVYHKFLKNYPFRSLLFYGQLLYGFSGVLGLFFVLRWNLKLLIPDYFFVLFEECCTRIVTRIRWMPMMVLGMRLSPPGIEGTFFALFMCLDTLGSLSSKTGGGLILHVFHVTRTNFDNLWLVMLISSALRMAVLGLVFLLPEVDQSGALLPPELLSPCRQDEEEQKSLLHGRIHV